MTDEKQQQADTSKSQYMASVKVGAKGQIIIPKKARDLFHINPGDVLLLRADNTLGIAIQPFDMVKDLFEGFFTNATS